MKKIEVHLFDKALPYKFEGFHVTDGIDGEMYVVEVRAEEGGPLRRVLAVPASRLEVILYD